MIPKYGAWDIHGKKMMNKLLMISFVRKEVICKYDGGNNSYPLKIGEEAILMQSTGLFDSQSEPKEIYKDDVVKRISLIPGGKDFIGVVKMLEGCWVIDNCKEAINLWTEVDENIVIGNIWENPELVEGV